MVRPVNGSNDAPTGYTKVTLNDNATNQKKTYFVPVGKRLVAGNKTFDLTNGEIIINSRDNQNEFRMIGITLEHFDTNKDGKIDSQDSSVGSNIGDNIHKDRNKPKGYDLMHLGLGEYDAYLENGNGYANFTKDNENFYEVRIEKQK